MQLRAYANDHNQENERNADQDSSCDIKLELGQFGQIQRQRFGKRYVVRAFDDNKAPNTYQYNFNNSQWGVKDASSKAAY